MLSYASLLLLPSATGWRLSLVEKRAERIPNGFIRNSPCHDAAIVAQKLLAPLDADWLLAILWPPLSPYGIAANTREPMVVKAEQRTLPSHKSNISDKCPNPGAWILTLGHKLRNITFPFTTTLPTFLAPQAHWPSSRCPDCPSLPYSKKAHGRAIRRTTKAPGRQRRFSRPSNNNNCHASHHTSGLQDGEKQ